MNTLTLENDIFAGLTWPFSTQEEEIFGGLTWPLATQRSRQVSIRIDSTAEDHEAAQVAAGAVWKAEAATHDSSTIAESSAHIAALSSSLVRVLEELQRYEEYEPSWDGYSAEPFEDEVLQRARTLSWSIGKHFLSSGEMPDLFTTGPAPDGSLDIELRRGLRRLFFILYPTEQESEIAALEEGKPANVEALGAGTVDRWLEWLVS